MDALGRLLGGSADNNWVKPYFNFSLNASYNLQVGDMKQFQVFGPVEQPVQQGSALHWWRQPVGRYARDTTTPWAAPTAWVCA